MSNVIVMRDGKEIVHTDARKGDTALVGGETYLIDGHFSAPNRDLESLKIAQLALEGMRPRHVLNP